MDPEASARQSRGTDAVGSAAERPASSSSDTIRFARLSSVTGLIFAVLLAIALVLVHSAPTLQASDAELAAFYASNNTTLVTVGLYLVPFAGIAFLWHLNTVRLLIRTRTPAPSAISDGLQLMAGILFVALLFAGTAAAGGVALLKDLGRGPLPTMDVARGLLVLGYSLVFVYAVRGAGMYALSTTTLLANAKLLPKPLAVLGYLLAAFLLISTTTHPVVLMLLPAWAVLVSVVVLVRTRRREGSKPPPGGTA
jgi:hypothetical protein